MISSLLFTQQNLIKSKYIKRAQIFFFMKHPKSYAFLYEHITFSHIRRTSKFKKIYASITQHPFCWYYDEGYLLKLEMDSYMA